MVVYILVLLIYFVIVSLWYVKSNNDKQRLNKKLPKLNKNVVPIVGWVQDTLSPFLEKYKPKINFVNMDMDTYETTKFVLTKIKPFLNHLVTDNEFEKLDRIIVKSI